MTGAARSLAPALAPAGAGAMVGQWAGGVAQSTPGATGGGPSSLGSHTRTQQDEGLRAAAPGSLQQGGGSQADLPASTSAAAAAAATGGMQLHLPAGSYQFVVMPPQPSFHRHHHSLVLASMLNDGGRQGAASGSAQGQNGAGNVGAPQHLTCLQEPVVEPPTGEGTEGEGADRGVPGPDDRAGSGVAGSVDGRAAPGAACTSVPGQPPI